MYVFKWARLNTCMFFSPDDGGGGSEAPSAPSGTGGDGVGGGGSVPSAAPSPSPAPESAPSGDGTSPGFDWSALGSTDDLDHIEIPAPKAPVVEPPKPVEPVPPPQPQPAPQTTPVEPSTAQPATGEARPLTASDPWRIAEGLEANRDAVVAHLAGTKFALSEAEIQEIDTDVLTAIPKLLSRVFLESQVSMQKFLAQAVPGMVRQYNTVTSANDDAEKKFFAAHKALSVNNPQHRAAAVRIATVYRQANPNIPLDQLIAEVGPMVMTALRVNAQATPQATPVASTPRGGTPFRPAVNGGGGLSPNPEPESPWAGLGRNYDDG